MSGLVGIFEPGSPEDRLNTLLTQMCATMSYETWYQHDRYVQSSMAAARVGLGIINTQPQPGRNEDGSILVWMDGEIYDFQRRALEQRLLEQNHRMTAGGDAELLAHLYEELGEACFHDLSGTFAVAIFDRRVNKVILAVDRRATRPLFFYSHNNRFIFASKVKAILEDHRVPRRVDEQGVIELFSLRHLMADRTLFSDIHFLPAGQMAVYQDGTTQVRPYWSIRVIEDEPLRPRESYVEEITATLRQALERQMYDRRPTGEFLSGGLDSRLLAGLMPPMNGRFHTFSRGPQDCWDVQYGARVANKVGSQHHHLELKPDFLLERGKKGVWITDGLMTVNDIYVLSTIEQVKPYVDVIFLGNGNGILAGVGLSKRLLKANTLDEAAQALYDSNSVFMPEEIQSQVLTQSLYQRTRGVAFSTLRHMLDQYDSDTPHGKVEAFCDQCRWPRSAWWGTILSRTQVETRSPFSDNDFCDLVRRVPARWRLSRQMQLAVLKNSRPDLAQIPWDHTGIPASMCTPTMILMRKAYFRARRELESLTHGLIPAVRARERAHYGDWYRTVLRPWLEGILLDERTLSRGYYERAGIERLIEEHMHGSHDRSLQFGLLLTFELWNRLFIDGETP